MTLPLSKDPIKAKINMSDWNCLVCGCTLFIDDSNPCNSCQREWQDKDNRIAIDILRREQNEIHL